MLDDRVSGGDLVSGHEAPIDEQPLDLELTLPLSVAEATFGATVPVPTLEGAVTLTAVE